MQKLHEMKFEKGDSIVYKGLEGSKYKPAVTNQFAWDKNTFVEKGEFMVVADVDAKFGAYTFEGVGGLTPGLGTRKPRFHGNNFRWNKLFVEELCEPIEKGSGTLFDFL